MISNDQVISDIFPFAPIRLQLGGRIFDLNVRLDTGLTGGMKVPPEFIDSELLPDDIALCVLGDEREVHAPVYQGSVTIGPFGPFDVSVIALGNEPLIGRGLSDLFMVILDHGIA